MELKIVTFEQAKKLAELGFPQDYECVYVAKDCWVDDSNYGTHRDEGELDRSPSGYSQGDWIEAPTLDLVNKWFRDEKNYYIQIGLDLYAYGDRLGYYLVVSKLDENFDEVSPVEPIFFKTYEEALSAGIDYVLGLLKNNGKQSD